MESFFTFLTGIVSALVPIIGHHLGAGRKDRVAPDFYQFLYMGFRSITDPLCPRFLGAPLVLGHLGLEPCGQKGSPWLPTLFEPWNYSPF